MTSIDLLPLETLRLAIKVGVLKLKGPDKNSIVRIPRQLGPVDSER